MSSILVRELPSALEVPDMRSALRDEVADLLERRYRIDFNAAEKVIDLFWGEGYLPDWYFVANEPADIARHLYATSQLLNAETEMLRQISEDGFAVTYVLSVGHDFPGRLAGILRENLEMEIVAFDSVKSAGGVSFITIERRGRPGPSTATETAAEMNALRRLIAARYSKRFADCLSARYLIEELRAPSESQRAERHAALFDAVLDSGGPVVRIEPASDGAVRSSVAFPVQRLHACCAVLDEFRTRSINIERAYYDSFPANGSGRESGDRCVGVLSIYSRAGVDGSALRAAVETERRRTAERDETSAPRVERELEWALKRLSDPSTETAKRALEVLRTLARKNGDPDHIDAAPVFIVNALSDFFASAELSGIARSDEALRTLLRFEAFDEFWVRRILRDDRSHVSGYRSKHSTARGPAKGGMRIDRIVEFAEVSALAFMMTWKCARSRLLFGGAKGGVVLDPRAYRGERIDFFDTLGGFGRSTFLVTGPTRDVPAGDVGCGPEEIGYIFEGFKSALADIAGTVYGVKQGVARIADRVVTTEQAREMLSAHFGIDYHDRDLVRRLTADEHYLELVAASHITGKPRMGIAARTGATGRGIVYSLLATIGRRHLDGDWRGEAAPTEGERELLHRASQMGERYFLAGGGASALSESEWRTLDEAVYPKLLEGARVVVQGAGKVGSSVMRELEKYGVRIVAVADRDGAIVGNDLAVEAIVEAAVRKGSVVHTSDGVGEVIRGGEAGAAVLTLPCDILIPAALEHAITSKNAESIRANIVACGSNGPITARAQKMLYRRGITVIYDFLANSGGVTASYFEWLRNLNDRFRFEAEVIRGNEFDRSILDRYIMPEFRERIHTILRIPEGERTTAMWNALMRDIIYGALNDDMRTARAFDVPLKHAGMLDAQLRVLAAELARSESAWRLWEELPIKTREMLKDYLSHPEFALIGGDSTDLGAG